MPQYTSGGGHDVLPEGDYDFVVDDAGEKESAKHNPMIELQLVVTHNGTSVRVFDNLVFTKAAFWKIDQFRSCTGDTLVEGAEVNFEAEDCIDRKGRCHLIVDTYEGRSRNKVDAYLPPAIASKEPQQAISGGGSGGDPDDISFASAKC
jgi:hypothetical protein